MADPIIALRDILQTNWSKPPEPSIEDIADLDKGDAKRVRMLDNDVIRIFETAHNEAQPELLYDYVNEHVNITIDIRTVDSRDRLSELRNEVRRIVHGFRKGDGTNFDRAIFKTRTDLSDRSKKLFRYTLQYEIVTFSLLANAEEPVVNPSSGEVSGGNTYQTYDGDLTTLAQMTPSDSVFIVGNGSNWAAESGATARTSLGLGSMATQNSDAISITGGSISGVSGLVSSITAGTGITGSATDGAVTLNVGGLTVSELAANSLQLSSESFADNDTSLMTSAAIQDKILSYGYTTEVGDITAVTAGTGMTGGGSSGAVTLTLDLKDEDNMASNSATHAASQQSIKAYVDSEVAALIDNAPGALDTLNELAAAINDDAGFTGTITTALGNRVRADASQSFSSSEQLQARTNIGLNAASVPTAGTGIGISGSEISVDVSDFMSSGANNRVLTATGTDAFQGESTLTYDGSVLKIDNGGDEVITIGGGGSGYQSIELGGDTGAYIDLKSPNSDDFDIRIITTGNGGEIVTASPLTFKTSNNNDDITFTPHGTGKIKFGSGSDYFELPTARGSTNQILKSNGSGEISWAADDNDNHTYAISSATVTGGANLVLTAGGSGSGTDTVKLLGGTNTTISQSSDEITVVSNDTTYSTSVVDSSDDALIRLTAGGSGSGNDDIKLVAGANVTLTPDTGTSPPQITITASTQGDITGITAGTGLSGGGSNGDVTLNVDVSEFSAVTPASGDSFLTLDSDGSTEQRTTVDALATLLAGTNISASSGVLSSTDTNTFRTVTAGGETLGASETLAFTAGSNVTITESNGAVTIASTDTNTNTQLSQEQVEDFVGGMLDGTETFISVSYDDTDGNIDFVVPVLDEDNMASNSATNLVTQQSIKAYVDSKTASIVDSAPAALDTLNELAEALNDDDEYFQTMNTALGNRLRIDDNQSLSGTQQAQGLTNLGFTATLAEINILDDGLSASDIPSLATSKITSGTFDDARIAQSNVTQHLAVGSGGGIGLSGKTFTLDLDGMTDIGAALVDADLLIVDDGAGGTNRKATMSRLKTYMQNGLTFTTNTNTNQLTTFTLTADSGSNQTIEHGNTLDIAGSSPIVTSVGGTDTVTVSLDDPANLSELTESTDATDDKILLWDESASSWKYITIDNLQDSIDTASGGGAVSAVANGADNRIVTFSSADALNGEANLTFDGSALQLTGTLTVGVDDTGHDVKFFGATSGAYMLYDESADQLHIHGPNDALLQLNDGNDAGSHMSVAGGRAKFGYTSNSLVLSSSSGKGMIFAVNNGTFGSGEVARFDTSGNFGLGTTSPAFPLHLKYTDNDTGPEGGHASGASGTIGANAEGGGLYIENASTTDGAYAGITFRTDTADARIAYQSVGSSLSNEGQMSFYLDTNDTDGGSPDAVFTLEEVLRLRGGSSDSDSNLAYNLAYINGRLGVGTASPAKTLDVAGDIGLTGDIYVAQTKKIYFDSTDTYIGADADTVEDLHLGADGNISLDPDGDVIIRVGSGTEYVRFDGSEQRVGIGTTSPSVPLHVAASASDASTGVLISNTATSGNSSITALELKNEVGTDSSTHIEQDAYGVTRFYTGQGSKNLFMTVAADGQTTTIPGSIAGTATNATLAATVTVSDSTANTNFPVVFHDESNALLDDTGALRYNPSTGTLLVPNLSVAGTTTQVNTVTMEAQNAIVFEGATADAHETTLTITDPTADRTITLPNNTGTVALTIDNVAGLNAVNDRDLAPEDLSYANDFNVFFTSKEGLEDGSTNGSNYMDAIVLNTWSDASGHDANVLAFDKSTKAIYHYQADQAATNWGTASQLAYTSDLINFDGSTANGVLTYKDADEMSVESSLTYDPSGQLAITSSGYGRIEMQGDSGAYIDLKNSTSDDFDVRFITDGTGLDITTIGGSSPITLRTNNAQRIKIEDAQTTLGHHLSFGTTSNPYIKAGTGGPLAIRGDEDGVATSYSSNVPTYSTAASLQLRVNASNQTAMEIQNNKDIKTYGFLKSGSHSDIYGANTFVMGSTGSTEDNDWYEVFRWTPKTDGGSDANNWQYDNFSAKFTCTARGIGRSSFDIYVRGEYGTQDSNGWWTKEFIIDGWDDNVADNDTTFRMVYNAGTGGSNPYASLYQKRDEDWELRHIKLIQCHTNCYFDYFNTNVGETDPTHDTNTGSSNVDPSIRRKLYVDSNEQLINGVTSTGIYLDNEDQELVVKTDTDPLVRAWDTTDNYAATLQAASSGAWLGLGDMDSSDTSWMKFGAFSGTNNLDTKTRDFHLYGTNTATGFYFDESTGKFGIGTTAPTGKLTITDSGHDMIHLNRTVNNEGYGMGIIGRAGNSASTTAAHEYAAIFLQIEDNTDGSEAGSIAFNTSSGGTAADAGSTHAMQITSAGKVGIGTTSPQTPLHVIGNVMIASTDSDNTVKDSRILGRTYTNNDYNLIYGYADATTNRLYLGGGTGTGEPATDIRFFTAALNADTDASGTEAMRILSNGYVGIGTTSATFPLDVNGWIATANGIVHTGDTNNTIQFETDIQKFNTAGTTRMTIAANGNVTVAGAFSAATKSFDIEHPTKEGKRLHHGSLEGPEHGVYVRGRLEGDVIELPDYWLGLVDADTITVQLTPNNGFQQIYVDHIEGNKVYVGTQTDSPIDCFYFIQAERVDVGKMVVEY